jgi:hypothetical protein
MKRNQLAGKIQELMVEFDTLNAIDELHVLRCEKSLVRAVMLHDADVAVPVAVAAGPSAFRAPRTPMRERSATTPLPAAAAAVAAAAAAVAAAAGDAVCGRVGASALVTGKENEVFGVTSGEF